MSNVEAIATSYAPKVVRRSPGAMQTRATRARGFLIQLVAREIQISERVVGWLRTAAERMAGCDDFSFASLARECERLALETVTLGEDLVVLVHRLVARRNRLDPRRRVDVVALLNQPVSEPVRELLMLHQRNVSGEFPWIELAALRPLEQMLAGTIPLAIDVSGVDDSDLEEASQLFEARSKRAREFDALLTELLTGDPARAEARASLIAVHEEQAVAAFTEVLAECVELGRELDGWRHGFVR